MAIDPFWNGPSATKNWDTSHLSVEDEAHLGLDLHEMVMHFMPRYSNADAKQRVENAARPILPARSRKEIEYKFFVLDSNALNAFSLPGGYVYVTSKLLEWISEDEDYQLQFVLAHEIFHVDQKHALKCLEDPGLKSLPNSTLAKFYLFIIPRGYWPEAMDYEADAWAMRQLRRLKCSPRECMSFMRRLKSYAASDDWELERAKVHPRKKSKDPRGLSESLFDIHFRAHPPTYRRLAELEALADPSARNDDEPRGRNEPDQEEHERESIGRQPHAQGIGREIGLSQVVPGVFA